MEQTDILAPLPTGKVYKRRTITIATFIGGMIAGAYMIAANFKILGEPKKARQTWWGLAIVLVFFAVTCFIPALDNIPAFAYSLLFGILATYITQKYQDTLIANHLANGGEEHTQGNAVVVVLLSIAVLLALLMIVYVAADFSRLI